MKHYAVNFNIFLVSPAGVVRPQYTRLCEERYTEKIPDCEGKHLLVAQKRNRIVSGDFADDKAFVAYLEELVRKRTLCETLGVQFRRVPDSLLRMPARIRRYADQKDNMVLKRNDGIAFAQAVSGYEKYLETRAFWVDYIQSVIVE